MMKGQQPPIYSPKLVGPTAKSLIAEIIGEQNNRANAPKDERPTADKGNPFSEIQQNLGLDATNTATVIGKSNVLLRELNVEGYVLYYKRDNSHPQGRLMVDMGGSKMEICPGAKLTVHFESLRIFQSPNSVVQGLANLVIITQQGIDYLEPYTAMIPGLQFQPIDLVGNSSTPTFTTINADTQPAGLPTQGANPGCFRIDGLQAVRMLLDCLASQSTTLTLIPWLYDPNSATWYEQGTAAIGLPVPVAATRYREIYIPVDGNGYMFLEIRADTPDQATYGAIIQAIH